MILGSTRLARHHDAVVEMTALGMFGLATLAFWTTLMGEPAKADAGTARFTRVEVILKQAGASASTLARLQEQLGSASDAEIAEYEDYFRKQSPTELAKTVEVMRYDDPYVLGPDSKAQPGVPKGKTFEFTFDHSRIFPGTTRKITVYVPADYKGDKPACVYLGLDGLGKVPIVFDNLIFRHEMPITLAIGIAPGEVPSVNTPENPRYNRSFEFDGLSNNLARFLLEELFPEVERHTTPDGLPVRLSDDPNDRAVGGGSTGGIGAFTLAWERPDAFRRVFTESGTFVGMRGGDRYPVLVRKTEPKPIRIFMQDGSHDGLDGWLGEVGDWWMGNQALQRALEFAGYQVEHVWGEGAHGSWQGTVVFPDAMRYLWKDWPAPVTGGVSQNAFLKEILQPGETWEAIPNRNKVARKLLTASQRFSASGPEGRVYQTETLAGKVWLISGSHKKLIDAGLKGPTGITLSPDGLWLAVAESKTHWGYSYRVQPNGSVQNRQRFYWFHVPDTADGSGAGPWMMDRDGRLYAATRMGVQVFDRNGRVRAILPLPGGEVTALAFGATDLDTLYVETTNQRIYRRKLKVSGLQPTGQPIRLPPWGAG
jgi:hypothetical protein